SIQIPMKNKAGMTQVKKKEEKPLPATAREKYSTSIESSSFTKSASPEGKAWVLKAAEASAGSSALAGNPARMSGVISTLLISPLRIFSLKALYSMRPGPESGARELKTSNIAPKNTRYQIRNLEFLGAGGEERGGLRNPGSFLASGPSGTG